MVRVSGEFELTEFELAGFYCTKFVWEFKQGFVNVKAIVRRAVHLRECLLRELPLYICSESLVKITSHPPPTPPPSESTNFTY